MANIKMAELVLPLVLGSALTGGACTQTAKAPAIPAANPQPTQVAENKVIVRLVGRHYTVTVASSPAGVVYSASGRDGRMIVANASLDELRRDHPQIYQQIIPGIAEKHGEGTGRNTTDDASPAASSDRHIPGRIGPGERLLLMDAR